MTDINLLIRQLSQQDKSDRVIAEFLGINYLKVRAVLDKDYIQKKREAEQGRRFKENLMRKRVYYAPPPMEEQGTFLQSQEGREALDRISAPYEPPKAKIALGMFSKCKLVDVAV